MEMLLMSERRGVRRSVDLECQISRGASGELLVERVLDVSSFGMLLRSRGVLEVGEQLQLSFSLPGTELCVKTGGRVVRVGPAHSEGLFDIGIAFDSLDAETSRCLRSVLCALPEKLSSHPPRIDYAATASLIAFEDFGF